MNTLAPCQDFCAPNELKKKLQEIEKFIKNQADSPDPQGLLMNVLHETQVIFGYIPEEAMNFISQKLSVPTAHIYGMVTFYNLFTLKPRARYQISVCKGTACYVGGGARVLNKIKSELKISEGEMTEDGLFGLNITRCLGCCGLSPVIQVNDDIYVRMVPEKVPAIIKKYRRLSAQGDFSRKSAKKKKSARAAQ